MQPGQNQPRDDRPVLIVLGPGPAETHRLVSTHHGHQHEVIHVWDVPRVLLDKEDRGGRHGPPNGPGEDRSSQVLGTGPQGVPKAQNECFHRYSSSLSRCGGPRGSGLGAARRSPVQAMHRGNEIGGSFCRDSPCSVPESIDRLWPGLEPNDSLVSPAISNARNSSNMFCKPSAYPLIRPGPLERMSVQLVVLRPRGCNMGDELLIVSHLISVTCVR